LPLCPRCVERSNAIGAAVFFAIAVFAALLLILTVIIGPHKKDDLLGAWLFGRKNGQVEIARQLVAFAVAFVVAGPLLIVMHELAHAIGAMHSSSEADVVSLVPDSPNTTVWNSQSVQQS
jgi:preprotein translocase subunit SecG